MIRCEAQSAWLVLAIGLCLCASRGLAAADRLDQSLLNALTWQLALERHGFSPGLIDGCPGAKTALATREFQRAHDIPLTGKLDAQTAEALGIPPLPTIASPVRPYAIQQADLDAVAPVPKGWIAKSKLRFLGYGSLAEAVAERFHCSQPLLGKLNPRISLEALKLGDTVLVPAADEGLCPAVQRLEIHLSQKLIRGFNSAGQLVLLLHCSIAKDPAKRPSGEARIVSATINPAYRFDPAMWPEVKGVDETLIIPPGPRSPVGVCWIALSRPGYGIHGSPNPELIGKTGSHGCFRLTNWDAARLAKMVRPGTPVRFIHRDSPTPPVVAGADGTPAY